MQIINVTPNTPEWREIRRQGLGGSDAAAVLGMSKYTSPYELWLEKRGEAPGGEIQTDVQQRGHLLEPAVLQWYANKTGNGLKQIQGIAVSDKYPFIRATLDGLTIDGKISINAKTSRLASDWGEPETDEIPQEYLINSQHEMIVAGTEVHHIPVLLANLEFALYIVEADKELQQMIIDAEHDFWQRVQNGIEPELTGGDAEIKFKNSKAGVVQAGEYELDLIIRLKAARDARKSYEQTEEELTQLIKKALGEFDTLAYGNQTLVTWKSSNGSNRFDSSAFKQVHPELYQQFIKQTEGSRRFLVK